ncbi:MarR family winged helix-turn-helix transcriptional regulator [Comamonas sp. J-3]|uniref:MarR family winged helix-turn-helix transcriptional regulator n=1 Tax=Comamonas trifloxystrobinivorans TaxID=3350256 RepID=UPI003728CA0C
MSAQPPSASLTQPQQPSDLLLYRLSKLTASAARLVTRLCERRYGITRREWGVLMWLAQQPGLQPSQLAEILELDRARISRAIASMQAKGLLLRQADSSNRRSTALQLSEAGQRLHDELLPQIRAINVQLLAPLQPQAVEQLSESLHVLQQQVNAAEQHAAGASAFPPRQSGGRYKNAGV